jgi:hypothetical protein
MWLASATQVVFRADTDWLSFVCGGQYCNKLAALHPVSGHDIRFSDSSKIRAFEAKCAGAPLQRKSGGRDE